jgi:group I intron endonuclease
MGELMFPRHINNMVIYKVINNINGKWYIGKDARNNPNYFGSGIAIKHAIKKYGRENFTKEVLEICEDSDSLNKREAYWIDYANAINDPNSYNLAKGGQGGNLSSFWKSNKKAKWTEERREKMKSKVSGEKNGMFGKTLSPEHINKIIEANRNRDYVVLPSTREKLRLANLNKYPSEDTRLKMSTSRKKSLKIIHIESGKIFIFESTNDAISHFKVSRNKICSRTLHGYTIEEIK